jgi:mono/diheme cytochrome c family protein
MKADSRTQAREVLRESSSRFSVPGSRSRARMRRWSLAAIVLLSLAALGSADGSWLKNVPAHDHEKTNPYRGQLEAVAAGRRIFVDRCSKCHGDDAQGTKKRPPLKSERVQQTATEGDLHWLLVNGNMRKGMPSWAKLPDQQLWQVITYVKSLQSLTSDK